MNNMRKFFQVDFHEWGMFAEIWYIYYFPRWLYDLYRVENNVWYALIQKHSVFIFVNLMSISGCFKVGVSETLMDSSENIQGRDGETW